MNFIELLVQNFGQEESRKSENGIAHLSITHCQAFSVEHDLVQMFYHIQMKKRWYPYILPGDINWENRSAKLDQRFSCGVTNSHNTFPPMPRRISQVLLSKDTPAPQNKTIPTNQQRSFPKAISTCQPPPVCPEEKAKRTRRPHVFRTLGRKSEMTTVCSLPLFKTMLTSTTKFSPAHCDGSILS